MTDLALPHPGSPRPEGRAGRWVLLGLTAGAIAAAVVLMAHLAEPVYGVPVWGVAVAAALLAAVLGGARLVWTTGRFGLGLRVAAGAAAVVLGLLTLASIGLPVLVLGVVLLATAARSARGGVRVVAGATLIGAALPVLALLALSGPVVTCAADGVSTQENAFMALWTGPGGSSSSSSGGMSTGPGGTTAGRASGSAYTYSYVCRGDRLTSFHLRWR